MNLVDVVVLVVAGTAAYTGWRYGFVRRALSWLGLTIGIAVGALFVDDLMGALRDETSQARLFGALVLALRALAPRPIGGVTATGQIPGRSRFARSGERSAARPWPWQNAHRTANASRRARGG